MGCQSRPWWGPMGCEGLCAVASRGHVRVCRQHAAVRMRPWVCGRGYAAVRMRPWVCGRAYAAVGMRPSAVK
jgi:hypothetical protein